MEQLDLSLDNLDKAFPDDFSPEQTARAKTIFLKRLSELTHRFYTGKVQTAPKAGVFGFNWFNVWYTPGVSAVSTTIRDDNEASFALSNRGNLVAVVSDSTRVLGDGDCTPPGGLGVMEGKAYLMKYLGGVDAMALCIDSRDEHGRNDPQAIIDFVRRGQPSWGAVNLEDISQPNCYRVLDELRDACDIPVWHDDAQGTACVTLAGLLNALTLTGRAIADTRFALLGAGASNSTIARFLMLAGADPANIILCDSRGGLHRGRADIQADPRFYRKWELCLATNPRRVDGIEEAMRGADVLVSLSTPGPDVVKPQWIRGMAARSIVFVCANPVPEIYPHAAHEAGAYIVATGRGDFANQVNNSLGFPGILKGALLVRSRKITDGMAIAAARSLARYAEERGMTPQRILPTMDDADVFAREAADVAAQAVADGVARVPLPREEVFRRARQDIVAARGMTDCLRTGGYLPAPPREMLDEAMKYAVELVR